MKLENFNQGVPGSAQASIEPAGPGRARLTISHVKPSGDGDGVALRFKDFNQGTIIEGTADPVVSKPLPGGHIDDVVFNLGPEVTNALVRNLRGQNLLSVEADGIGDVRTLVVGELLLGADAPKAASAQPFGQPAQAPEQPAAPGAAPVQPAPEKKGHGALIAIIIAILVLLALAAFAAWWFLFRHPAAEAPALPDSQAQQQEQAEPAGDANKPDDGAGADQGAAQAPQDQQNAAQQQGGADDQPQAGASDAAASQAAPAAGQASGSASGSCSIAASDNDQALLKGCLATNPSDQDLMGLAKEALSNKRCDVGTRLLTSLGRSGKQEFALYYAKLADPNSRDASACVKKDAAGAKYWYQKALDAGSSDEASQALEKLK
jgi:hypothetical protein